jgi:hypothetical protein
MMDYSPEFETTQEMGWTKATLDSHEFSGSAKNQAFDVSTTSK